MSNGEGAKLGEAEWLIQAWDRDHIQDERGLWIPHPEANLVHETRHVNTIMDRARKDILSHIFNAAGTIGGVTYPINSNGGFLWLSVGSGSSNPTDSTQIALATELNSGNDAGYTA